MSDVPFVAWVQQAAALALVDAAVKTALSRAPVPQSDETAFAGQPL